MQLGDSSSADYLLVVDDEQSYRERMVRALERAGERVLAAATFQEAIMLTRQHLPQRAVVDLRMPGKSGLELVTELLKLNPSCKIIMLTGYGSIATTQEALKRGACWYLTKPCQPDKILAHFKDSAHKDSAHEDLAHEDRKIPMPSLEQVEWDYLQRVIADCGGNITNAAKVLGLNRRSLQRRLSKSPKLI